MLVSMNTTTVIWEIFMCNIFVLKYFHGLWQLAIVKHTKCILYTNIRAFNFRGSPALRKNFNNEHFPNYGTTDKPTAG